MGKNNILFTKKGNIEERFIEEMAKVGILVIECEDPDNVRFVDETVIPIGNAIAHAALGAINLFQHEPTCKAFVDRLLKSDITKPKL